MDHDVGAAAAVAEGAMLVVEVEGEKILLARVGGRCHAIGASCPHAGANLGEGALHGHFVTCPWHKASFDITTGRRTDPPAVDDLRRYDVREVDGRVHVALPGRIERAIVVHGGDPRCMVIAGAGAAGALAAQTLREEGFTGRVVMISREDRLPYDRTVLSKYALSGKQGAEKTPLQDAAFYDRHGIERLAAEIVALDPIARTVTLANGREITYDRALVATGGVPRPLEVPGHDLPGVALLRTPDDAEAIVEGAQAARQAVVIGAGYIGLEVAASLRERGLDVAVVAPQAVPLEKQLGPDVGAAFRRVHEQEGVVFHLGDEVAAIEGDGRVQSVRLKSGAVLPAGLVVAGLGIKPAAAFVQAVRHRDDGGLDVDARLMVTEGLYAAGDVAAFPLYGTGDRIRVEHWRVAQQHGRVAALNMLGRGLAYDVAPVFWTIQYLKRLDYVGHAETWDSIEIDGDLAKPEFVAYYVKDSRVAAVAGWSRDQQMATAVQLLSERRDWTPAALRGGLG